MKMKELCKLILNNPGLYGIFSRPSFGKTTILMQLVDEALKIKNGKAYILSFEISNQHWYAMSKKMGLHIDNVLVYDNADEKVSFEFIKKLLEESKKPVLIAIDYLRLSEISVKDYYKLSKKYLVPIVITGQISRSAQYRKNCKPKLEDVGLINNELDFFDFISILHRDNNCGTCFLSNPNPYISDNAELIIFKNNFEKLDNISLSWNKEKMKFIF